MRNKQAKLMSALRPLIVKHFSEAELRALCFDLDIDYELLPGREKSEKALELIAYSKRTNALDALVQACQDTRPQIEWPQIIEKELILSCAPTTKRKIVWLGVGLLIVALVMPFWLSRQTASGANRTIKLVQRQRCHPPITVVLRLILMIFNQIIRKRSP